MNVLKYLILFKQDNTFNGLMFTYFMYDPTAVTTNNQNLEIQKYRICS